MPIKSVCQLGRAGKEFGGHNFGQVELAVSISTDDPRFEEKEQFLRIQGLKTKVSFPLLIDRWSPMCSVGSWLG